VAVVVVVTAFLSLVVSARAVARLYTDRLWFGSLGCAPSGRRCWQPSSAAPVPVVHRRLAVRRTHPDHSRNRGSEAVLDTWSKESYDQRTELSLKMIRDNLDRYPVPSATG